MQEEIIKTENGYEIRFWNVIRHRDNINMKVFAIPKEEDNSYIQKIEKMEICKN